MRPAAAMRAARSAVKATSPQAAPGPAGSPRPRRALLQAIAGTAPENQRPARPALQFVSRPPHQVPQNPDEQHGDDQQGKDDSAQTKGDDRELSDKLYREGYSFETKSDLVYFLFEIDKEKELC